MDKCRECPPTDWPASAYVLLGREDLSLSCLAHSNKFTDIKSSNNVTSVSMSTPYMLHLHPVTIPSSVTDATGLDNSKLEDTDSMEGSTVDGMEHIFNSSTQLRYGRDLRLNEVCFCFFLLDNVANSSVLVNACYSLFEMVSTITRYGLGILHD